MYGFSEFDLPEIGLHESAWIIAGVFSLLAILISGFMIYKHVRNYSQPAIQRPIIRILIMVPIYVTDSWLSLRFVEYAFFLDVARDAYEGYVIYQFFILLVAYINTAKYADINIDEFEVVESDREGALADIPEVLELELVSESDKEEQVIEILSAKPRMHHPPPLCCLSYQPGRSFFNITRRCILQFAIIKPANAIFSCIMELLHLYGEGEITNFKRAYVYSLIVDNISITISMYFLVLFYSATKDELKPFGPVSKFLCIKAVVFFSFWQGVVVTIMVYLGLIHGTEEWTTEHVSVGLQDFLVCIEMFFISVLHIPSFGWKQFKTPEKRPLLSGSGVVGAAKSIKDVLDPRDGMKDVIDAFNVEKNAKKIKKSRIKNCWFKPFSP